MNRMVALFVIGFIGLSSVQEIVNIFGFDNPIIPNVVDLRSCGMGRTEISALGSNAIFSNPSVLGLMKNTAFNVGGYARYGWFKDDQFDEKKKEYESSGDDSHLSQGKYPYGKFSHLSLALPMEMKPVKITAGLGYNNSYDASFNVQLNCI